MIDYMFISTEN